MKSKISAFIRTKNSNSHKLWLKEIHKRYASSCFRPYVKTSAAYMEAYSQYKLKQWDIHNPKPWRWEGTQLDLFEKQYHIPWIEAREKELERVRSFVASVYDKLTLIGRYKTAGGLYIEKPINRVKRTKMCFNINEMSTNNNYLNNIQKIVNKNKKENSNLVCCILVDNLRKKGRIILPAA